MSGLIEHVERVDAARAAEVARLNATLNEEPRCDIADHDGPDPAQAKFHSGPAVFASKAPCGIAHIVCRSFRDAVWFVGHARCGHCGEEHTFLDIAWIEL